MSEEKFRFLFSGCALPGVDLVQYTRTPNSVEIIIGGDTNILKLGHLVGERDLFCLEITVAEEQFGAVSQPWYILGEVALYEINKYGSECQAHFNGIFVDNMTKAEFEIWSEQMDISEWEVCT